MNSLLKLCQKGETKMKIKSQFAIVDVFDKKVCKSMTANFEKKVLFSETPKELRIPVVITGYISDTWGDWDGESQEFSVCVEDIKAGNPGDKSV
jgi:hypothetical protein